MDNIVSRFEDFVVRTPNAVAITFGEQRYSYFELNNYSNYIAQLLSRRGVQSSAVIAVTGHKSAEMIAAIIAILKLNCSYMPMDISLPNERCLAMLSNANVTCILSAGTIPHGLENSVIDSIILNDDDFDVQSTYANPNCSISSDDPAYVMHTSGSTGAPKGVLVPHRGVIRLLVDTNYIEINETDKVLFHSNTSFDAGIFEIWAALLNGACLVISPHMTGDIASIFKLCKHNDISILLLATGLFHIFANFEVNELEALRYLVVGGDVMHTNAAFRVIEKNKNIKIVNGYGPAENTVFTTCLVINDASDIDHPVSIGKPITGTSVYLLDENQNEVQPGEIGELYTSGLGVALGYINAPDLTAEKFIRLPHIAGNCLLYRTGDLARMLDSQNYEFIGRCDKQVKIRGFRVELAEIEKTISSLSFVEDVCVCTTAEENKQLVAFVKIANHDSHRYDERFISNYLKSKLPTYCIPAFIKITDIFPLTSNGKINRNALQSVFNTTTNKNIHKESTL